MSNIPTKAELAEATAADAARAAQHRTEDEVKFFTAEIVKAMKSRQSEFEHPTLNVSSEVLARLQKDFAPEWTITVHNWRTGCLVTWA